MYFPVSIPKLIVMSLATLSLYQVYWFYQNWWSIKERAGLNIRPAWRAILSPFFCYPCFKKIDQTAETLKLPEGLAAGSLATAYVLLQLLGLLPNPYWLISLGSVLPLVPAQTLANEINAAVSPGHERNARFTGWNIGAIILAVPLWMLMLLGAFSARQH